MSPGRHVPGLLPRVARATALAALVACTLAASPGDAARPTARVDIRMFQFQPDTLEVLAGTRVVWHNQDETGHAVTAGTPERPEGWADRELAGRGSSTEIVFRRPGLFVYHCERHPHMSGVVHVTRKGQQP